MIVITRFFWWHNLTVIQYSTTLTYVPTTGTIPTYNSQGAAAGNDNSMAIQQQTCYDGRVDEGILF